MKDYLFAVVTAALVAWPACVSAQTTSSITLTSYNIHSAIPRGHSRADYFAGPDDLKNVADVLTTTGANIVALQEVCNLWLPQPKFKPTPCAPDMPQYVAGLLYMNYAFASTLDAVPGLPENRTYKEWGNADQWTNNGARHGEYGNALLSTYEMSEPTLIALPRGNAEAIKVGDEPRNAVRVELSDVPGLGKVVVYGTHLQHNNGATREAQMKALLEHAAADATTATVFIMGDMNHTPHPGEPDLLGMVKTAGFHDLAAEYAAANGVQPEPTMHESMLNIRIDYVFCSKPVEVTAVKVLHTDVSDHYPLAVTIAVK